MTPRDIDIAELSSSGPSTFLIRGARIRYNPTKSGAGVQIGEHEIRLGEGTIELHGFDVHSAGVMGCYFEKDETLPDGTFVIESRDGPA